MHDWTCGGRNSVYRWNITQNHNCANKYLLNIENEHFERLQRGNQVEFFKKVMLPPCLNITTEKPFTYGTNPFFMTAPEYLTLHATFLSIEEEKLPFIELNLEKHDSLFDFRA